MAEAQNGSSDRNVGHWGQICLNLKADIAAKAVRNRLRILSKLL
jgi:hypothetical protein